MCIGIGLHGFHGGSSGTTITESRLEFQNGTTAGPAALGFGLKQNPLRAIVLTRQLCDTMSMLVLPGGEAGCGLRHILAGHRRSGLTFGAFKS